MLNFLDFADTFAQILCFLISILHWLSDPQLPRCFNNTWMLKHETTQPQKYTVGGFSLVFIILKEYELKAKDYRD